MYLNANIPPIECFVRGNYLRDQKDSHDKYFECVIFGFTSIPKQVPLFHYMMTDGGIWWRSPISAFCKKPDVKELPLNELMLWDSFSYNVSVTRFYQLDGCKCGHVIELDDGNYAIQPNNRLRIFDPSMAADPSKPLIHRLVNTRIWSVEDTSKWITDENQEGSYDYDYKELKDD
jgi:hypothetical protein